VWSDPTPVVVVVPLDVHSESAMTFADASNPKTNRHTPTAARRVTHTPVRIDTGQTDKSISLIGVAGPSVGGGLVGLGPVGPSTGRVIRIFDGKTMADNIVYVIDRSGSMTDTFETVKLEILRSIGELSHKQSYHIILFAEGQPLEDRTRQLKRATHGNKALADEFLYDIVAIGKTDPVPSLKRAFRVLSGSRGSKNLIVLLTDGAFDDSDEVRATMDKLNGDRTVRVNTFLYGNRPPEAVEAMKKIAQTHNGKYHFVQDGS
jgi:hypothetical protein